MKKVFSFLFVLIVTAAGVWAQKPDVEKINTTYRQFPDRPVHDSIKTYSFQVVNNSKTEVTLRYDEISKYLTLDGFQLDQKNPDMVITVVINDVPIELGNYPKGRTNGVPVQFVYTAKAKLVGTISFTTANNKYEFYSVSELDKPEDLTSTVESPTYYANEEEAKKAQANDKALQDKAIKEFYPTVFKNIGAYLNKHYGYAVKTEYLPVWGIKSKGTDYQDFNQALAAYQAALPLLNQPDKKDEMQGKFKEAIGIWEKAVAEYNPSNKDARISEKNILETYVNLTLANTWIGNFAEAKKYYALAEKEKGLNMWKPIVQELMLSQEKGAAQDQIRRSGNLKIEKKLCALYRSPEFSQPLNSKYRIKYMIGYNSDQKVIDYRKVFEYDEKGFLIKMYDQQYNVVKKEYYGAANIRTVTYNHHENTITVPDEKKDRPAAIYTIKNGQIIKKNGYTASLNDTHPAFYDYAYNNDGTIKKITRKSASGKEQYTWTFNKQNGVLKDVTGKYWSKSVGDTLFDNSKFELTYANGALRSFTSYFNNQGKNDLTRKGAVYQCVTDANGLVTKILTEMQMWTFAYDANKNVTDAQHHQVSRYSYEWEEGPGHPGYFLLNPENYQLTPGVFPNPYK